MALTARVKRIDSSTKLKLVIVQHEGWDSSLTAKSKELGKGTGESYQGAAFAWCEGKFREALSHGRSGSGEHFRECLSPSSQGSMRSTIVAARRIRGY